MGHIDVNPETYDQEIGWTYDDDDQLAQDLGWDTFDEALQSIADRFGYREFADLEDDIFLNNPHTIYAWEAQLSPAEHIIVTNLA